MAETALVHIGIGKTGTSAIQAALRANQAQLLAQGVLVSTAGNQDSGRHGLTPLNCETLDEHARQSYERLRAKPATPGVRTGVISAEAFSFVKPAIVSKLARRLKGHGVTILIYVRRQIELIPSSFLQALKVNQAKAQSLEDYWHQTRNMWDFEHRIQPWSDEFGSDRIRARLYHRQIQGENVLDDFTRLAGLPALPITQGTARRNPSLLEDFVPLIQLVDAMKPDTQTRQAIVKELLRVSEQFSATSKRTLVDEDMVRRIADYYRRSNKNFGQRFLTSRETQLLLEAEKPRPGEPTCPNQPRH